MRNILNKIKSSTAGKYNSQLKSWAKALALALLFIILQTGTAQAITVSASPNPQATGLTVIVNIAATKLFSVGSCTLQVNYGDSAAWTDVGTCTGTAGTVCNYVANHIYATSGTRTITAQSKSGACSSGVYTPNPATTTITINPAFSITSPSTLSTGAVGAAYSYLLTATGGTAPYSYSVVSGSLPAGLTLTTAGLITGTPTSAGTFTFTVRAVEACTFSPCYPQSTQKVFTLTINPALSITSPSPLSTGMVGTAYSYQLTATGGNPPYVYSVVSGSLPAGLTLTTAGLITGTPTAIGTSIFTVQAADQGGLTTAQKTFTITVNPAACSALSITSPSTLSTGLVGSAYSYQLTASGGQAPYTYSLVSGALPAGTTLTAAGLITGTPATAGTYSFTINVADTCGAGVQNTQKTFTITINPTACSALSITSPSTLSTGLVGSVYSYQLTASGGQAPYTYSLVSGALPAGTTLTAAGLITGTPATAGAYSFTINVADTCGAGVQNTQKTFILTISNPFGNSVNVSTSFFRVPRGMSSLQNLSYSFSAGTDLTLQSDRGVFMAGGSVIGEVNTLLNVTIRNGRAIVSESLTVPPAISQRAENLGTTRITYVRIFSGAGVSVTAQTEGAITTEAGADFKIKRLQLYFDNGRPEITVKRNQPSVKVYADISFSGSGLLQGYWEVDGRVLFNINRTLVYGATVTIESPDVPALPTFDFGTHIVRLVITNPSGLTVPQAMYFVTTEEAKEILRLKLLFPENRAETAYSAVNFEWEGRGHLAAYLIEFLEQGREKPVFSAYTKTPAYKIPGSVLKSVFLPGKTYLWRVKGFDADGSIAAVSAEYSFTFGELVSHVPGQIVVAAEASERWGEMLTGLADRYPLSLVEDFDIKALGLKVAVLHTKEDIFKLINLIMKEPGIIIAQPNYIFGTMAEKVSRMQSIYKLLNLGKLHKQYSGKGTAVAIIDTAVDTGHKALKDGVVFSENLLKDYSSGAEVHGTAVAGIIAANDKDSSLKGVAPNAEIVALRACRQVSEAQPEGECTASAIAKALDMAMEKKAKVVNMSFGSNVSDKLIYRLIEEGSQKGVVFVAPAGNRADSKVLAFPASHPNVISVCGMDDKGKPYPNKELASKARVCAPSSNIYTTMPGDRYNFMSGTSMSSAAVSGIIALAAEKNRAITAASLPVYKGSICKWAEEVFKTPLCGK